MRVAQHTEGDFLPDLCTHQAVFSLILVGELLAFAFVVIEQGFAQFRWSHFGAVSFLVQWVVLASAACLCPLRPWLKRQNGIVAGSTCYIIVLVLTAVFTVLGQWLVHRQWVLVSYVLLENLIIAAIFAGVVLRYFYLQQQLSNREQAELQSRIQALQSRIRPHFLFNSMNSIASLIDIDPQAAEKMVVDLSQLFRASLSEAGSVPLSQEIRLCEQFVSIEQMRLGERLCVEWHIQADTDAIAIPSLLLQPLIENAIYHGIQPLPEGGVVSIDITQSKNIKGKEMLCIHVSNPFTANASVSPDKNNGIALENIRRRLEAHFAGQAEFDFDQGDTRCEVSIRYPVTTVNE